MAKTGPSISIIVPCYNEEGNIRDTFASIKKALEECARFSDYEVIIFNDCSTDATGRVAEEIKGREKNVTVVHNTRNMGFGYNYTDGVRRATKDYILMVPGDNEIPTEAIKKVCDYAGQADVIIPYTANTEVRPLARRVISKAFVVLINTLFSLGLRYYNGTCVIKSSLLKEVPLKTWGFAYMAAILVRLLRSGASYIETGVNIQPRESGSTKAFRPKNVISVVKAIATLFWDVRIKQRSKYNLKAHRTEGAGA